MTNIEDIFSRFLQKISDYKFFAEPDSEEDKKFIEETLYGYFKTARTGFYHCRKDLTTNKDDISEYLPTNEIMINSDLTELEKEILAMLMITEYFKQIMLRNTTLEQVIGDADFNITSQANHINQLRVLYKQIRRETNTKINQYTFIGEVYG